MSTSGSPGGPPIKPGPTHRQSALPDGGPMLLAEASCIKEGIRPIGVRREQVAAPMGQAYSRLPQRPSVCMAAGPGLINLTSGLANALVDCCSVVDRRLEPDPAVWPAGVPGDRPAIMRGCVKWADRVHNLKRIPEQVNNAYTRYDKMAEALGCYGDDVDKAEDIRPALERAHAGSTRAEWPSSTCAPTIALAPARCNSRSLQRKKSLAH